MNYEQVKFTDASINAPTSWNWTLSGADSNSSNLRNPEVQFITGGYHTIKLVVSNSFGTDSLLKTAYVYTTDSVSLCSLFEIA